MSKTNPPSEHDLEQLYKQRKRSHRAPASIKKHILAKQDANINLSATFQRMGFITTLAFTFTLFGLFFAYQMKFSQPELETNQVFIHTLNPEQTLFYSQRSNINQRYTEAYNAYIKQKTDFVLHHNKRAKLELTQDGWQLKTCEDNPMLISNELIAALKTINQIDTSLNSGDVVNIAFAHNGIVLNISQSSQPMLCS